MIAKLPGYELNDILHTGLYSVVYRGRKLFDNSSVIIKVLHPEASSHAQSVARFRHEYNFVRQANTPCMLEHYEYGVIQDTCYMVMEDIQGVSLHEHIKAVRLQRSPDGRKGMETMLTISVKLVTGLMELHRVGIIHKDIKPENIIVNLESGIVKIIDYGISSTLDAEEATVVGSRQLEGTLAYISPEQTGRMNRKVDYRTDLYSVGITLYEMLTGKVPFEFEDPMEVIHSHIARKPLQPIEIEPTIPRVLSDIVMKCLAKSAEERYQSAFGLLHDLEHCLREWVEIGHVHPFPIGMNDRVERFILPQKLYGREREIAALEAALERARIGNTELLLVTGSPGIGKSSIIQEVHKGLIKYNGYFASGKFEQYKRDIPYDALVHTFRALIDQILKESEEQVDMWRGKLKEELGSLSPVMVQMIPEMELILGKQPPMEETTPAEANNRFRLAIRRFILLFARKEHPLCLLLDDLQWADLATLRLLQRLLSEQEGAHLLLIGAFRDEEVGADHPLMELIQFLAKNRSSLQQIHLDPLDLPAVRSMVAETVKRDDDETSALSEIVLSKTKGNPMFVGRLLKSLFEDDRIRFNHEQGVWIWDIDQIMNVQVSEDFAEFMLLSLQRLSSVSQRLMQIAACIGNTFNTSILAVVCPEYSSAQIAEGLEEALKEGLLLPIGEGYKYMNTEDRYSEAEFRFIHDRVQQAAYSLLPDDIRPDIHLIIGRYMQQKADKNQWESTHFDLVHHLNAGADRITDEDERVLLAEWNLLAGRRAKSSVAYPTADQLIGVGISLLPEHHWQSHRDLTFQLYREYCETRYLIGRFDVAEQYYEQLLGHVRTRLEIVDVYGSKVNFYCYQNKHQEGTNVGKEGMHRLGILVPGFTIKAIIAKELMWIKRRFRQGSELILDLPDMTDPEKRALMRFGFTVMQPFRFVNPILFAYITLKMTRWSLEYGNCPESMAAYSRLSLLYCFFGKIDAGSELAHTANRLLERYPQYTAVLCLSLVWAGSDLWRRPMSELIPSLGPVFQNSLATGDIMSAGLLSAIEIFYRLASGRPLEQLMESLDKYKDFVSTQINDRLLRSSNPLYARAVSYLTAQSPPHEPIDLDTDYLLERDWHLKLTPRDILLAYFTIKAQLQYLFGQTSEALATIEQGLGDGQETGSYVEYRYYYAIIIAAEVPRMTKADQRKYRGEFNKSLRHFEIWSKQSDYHYLHKLYMLKGEQNRLRGNSEQALKYYKAAQDEAKKMGYLQHTALAQELTARLLEQLGFDDLATAAYTQSYYTYKEWGAHAKAADLQSKTQVIHTGRPSNTHITNSDMTMHSTASRRTNEVSTTSFSASDSYLDMSTIIKTSQAISTEIRMDRLLSKLLGIAMENAGAQFGCILLEQDGAWSSAAEVSIDGERASYSEVVVQYTARMGEPVVLEDASRHGAFSKDGYFAGGDIKSVLCVPFVHQGETSSIVYLENNLSVGAFTEERVKMLRLLSSQMAIAIQNARLYTNLEQSRDEITMWNEQLEGKVEERTSELQLALEAVRRTQAQLLDSEKMASLGQLTAGIAHEINNPINFVSSNISPLSRNLEDLIEIIRQYDETVMAQSLQNDFVTVHKLKEQLEFDYVVNETKDLLRGIGEGAKRTAEIVRDLRIFSRLDEDDVKKIDIHEGINSTLTLLRKKADGRVSFVKEYGEVGEIECYPGKLNQVFMNIIGNAIDAIVGEGTVSIATEAAGDQITIVISDTGPGMPEHIRSRIFEPFFTTKEVGQGTGLGLSITYGIIEKHHGRIDTESEEGKGTRFIISLPLRQPNKGGSYE